MMNDMQWPLRRGGRKKPPISARPERMLAATYGGRKKLPISARSERMPARSDGDDNVAPGCGDGEGRTWWLVTVDAQEWTWGAG